MPEPVGCRLLDYANVPKTIAVVISNGKATLAELQTAYGLEDLFDLLEVVLVDNYNSALLNKPKGER